MSVIALHGVSKKYRGVPLFDDVTFELDEGRAYGLVGPNGSGKSVLFRIICGFTRPDAGEVVIDPRYLSPKRTFPERFGVTIDGPAYLPFETGFENLRRLAAIRREIGRAEIRDAMAELGLDPDARQRVRNYSLGMKQKLSLAQALMEKPAVLVLDEPFNGLDVDSCSRVTAIPADRVASGVTLLFTSHNADDIDTLAHAVLKIDRGTITLADASNPRSD